jgi:lysophospholipase L1-like esterase
MSPFLSKRFAGKHKNVLPPFTMVLIWFVSPLLVAALSAEASPVPQRPSEPTLVVEQGLAGLVDLVFLFDRVFTSSTSVTSPDYVKRVSSRSSRFYRDYVEYEQNRISRAELVRRLPHVALLGDSLSKDVYICPTPRLFWRVRTAQRRNWFLDTDPRPESIRSFYERINEVTPLIATEYASAGAFVTAGSGDEALKQRLVRVHNFAGQVDRLLKAKRFPDLTLVWIGHNNLDWLAGATAADREHPEKRLHQCALQFGTDYRRQLRRLITRAENEDHKTAIVVLGLFNCREYFRARAMAEKLHAADPKRFPYLELDYKHVESMRPEYRGNITRLSLLLNAEIRNAVTELSPELRRYPKVRVQYCDVLAKLDVDDVNLINPYDAWHPSQQGHNYMAAAVFRSLKRTFRFLDFASGN